jgi:hypothetical protein
MEKKKVVAVVVGSVIKDHTYFFDSKLYFHNHIDFIFSEYIKLLDLIHIFISSHHTLDQSQNTSRQYGSLITSINSDRLEFMQHKFAAVCFYRFIPQAKSTFPT